jgi:hypothetical protein
MANKKFSEFTTRTDSANVDFLVGYDGSTNVKIAPSNVGGGGGFDGARYTHNFSHSGNSAANWYFFPNNDTSELTDTARFNGGITPLADGYVSKIRMTCINFTHTGGATETSFRVLVNGSVVYTSSAQAHGTVVTGTTAAVTLGATDATFSAGDRIVVQFNTDGLWSQTLASTEHTYS